MSMMSAVFDVKALPEYTTNKGEVCLCTVLLVINNFIIVLNLVGNH